MILWLRGLRVGSQNRSQINPNLKSKMECLLASMFDGFWLVFGSENRSKIDQKSIPKGIRKMIENKELLGNLKNPPEPIGLAARGRGGGDAAATPRKGSGRIRILGTDIIRK